MKVSPVAPAVPLGSVDAQGQRAESIRTIKMNVSRTPEGRFAPATEEVVTPEENKDNIEKPNATVEATEPLSPQFAALAKQRRVLQQERRAFEEAKKAHEANTAQGSDVISKAQLQKEPLKILLENGVTYDQLTEAILANQGSSEVNALKAEINALKEGIDNKFKEKETQGEQQVLAEMRREADRLIVGSDEYELVRETRSVPDVMRLIEKTYRDTGEVLDVSEALKLVEDELFNRQQKLASTKKLQSFYKPAEQPMQQQRPGMTTLTNKHTASQPMDRRARALAAALGTLKK